MGKEGQTDPSYFRVTAVEQGVKKPMSMGMAQIRNEAEWDAIRKVGYADLGAYIAGETNRRKDEKLAVRQKAIEAKRQELQAGA